MTWLLSLLLRPFLPWATRWVQKQEALIIAQGRSLTRDELDDARRAGVSSPEKIHLLVVPLIQPSPHPLITVGSKFANLIGPHIAGLTLNYGIYIRQDCVDYRRHRELYVHEFCHVGQYERLGSIRDFLSAYLVECISPGYPLGVLEQEAIQIAARIIRADS